MDKLIQLMDDCHIVIHFSHLICIAGNILSATLGPPYYNQTVISSDISAKRMCSIDATKTATKRVFNVCNVQCAICISSNYNITMTILIRFIINLRCIGQTLLHAMLLAGVRPCMFAGTYLFCIACHLSIFICIEYAFYARAILLKNLCLHLNCG